MPMTTKDRTELREELVGQGFSWDYVDEWPSKSTYYVHRAVKNPSGEVVRDVGTEITGLPGNPDYARSKARQGLLPWPPNENCTCAWCRKNREVTTEKISASSDDAPAPRGRKVGPNYGAV